MRGIIMLALSYNPLDPYDKMKQEFHRIADRTLQDIVRCGAGEGVMKPGCSPSSGEAGILTIELQGGRQFYRQHKHAPTRRRVWLSSP